MRLEQIFLLVLTSLIFLMHFITKIYLIKTSKKEKNLLNIFVEEFADDIINLAKASIKSNSIKLEDYKNKLDYIEALAENISDELAVILKKYLKETKSTYLLKFITKNNIKDSLVFFLSMSTELFSNENESNEGEENDN